MSTEARTTLQDVERLLRQTRKIWHSSLPHYCSNWSGQGLISVSARGQQQRSPCTIRQSDARCNPAVSLTILDWRALSVESFDQGKGLKGKTVRVTASARPCPRQGFRLPGILSREGRPAHRRIGERVGPVLVVGGVVNPDAQGDIGLQLRVRQAFSP